MEREFKEITIKEYVSTLAQMPYESELEYLQRRVSIVLRQPIESIKALPHTIFMDYVDRLKAIEDNLSGYKIKKKVKISGKWFAVDMDIMKITTDQFT